MLHMQSQTKAALGVLSVSTIAPSLLMTMSGLRDVALAATIEFGGPKY